MSEGSKKEGGKWRAEVNIARNWFFAEGRAKKGFVLGPKSEWLKNAPNDHWTVGYNKQGNIVKIHRKVGKPGRETRRDLDPQYLMERFISVIYREVRAISLKELREFDEKYRAISLTSFKIMDFCLPILEIFGVFKGLSKKVNSKLLEKRLSISLKSASARFILRMLGVFLQILSTVLRLLPSTLRVTLLKKLLHFVSVKPSELTLDTQFLAIMFGREGFFFLTRTRDAILILKLEEEKERKRKLREILIELEMEHLIQLPERIGSPIFEVVSRESQ